MRLRDTFENKVKRKWCANCQSWTPHKEYWYEDTYGTCLMWQAETGICGCSAFGPEPAKKPDSACNGGYAISTTCCRCLTPRWKDIKNWTRLEELPK